MPLLIISNKILLSLSLHTHTQKYNLGNVMGCSKFNQVNLKFCINYTVKGTLVFRMVNMKHLEF